MVSRARTARDFERAFESRTGRPIEADAGQPPANVRAVVAGRLRARDADLRFDLRGLSEFEQSVLRKAFEIPRGEVRPYSWIAREIGHPDAVRATGSALAKNPVPVLIPCHRVVRSDGHIGNYSLGGPRNKRTLLEVEGAQPATLEKLASSGVRYFGNAEEKYFCFPTCGGIDSLMRDNRVHFASHREALDAGYRPCEACRPGRGGLDAVSAEGPRRKLAPWPATRSRNTSAGRTSTRRASSTTRRTCGSSRWRKRSSCGRPG